MQYNLNTNSFVNVVKFHKYTQEKSVYIVFTISNKMYSTYTTYVFIK